MSFYTDAQQAIKNRLCAPAPGAAKQRAVFLSRFPTRYLRVQCLSRQSQSPGLNTPVYHYPMLRLWGKWLQDAGFTPGSCVSVIVTSGQIVIRKRGEGE